MGDPAGIGPEIIAKGFPSLIRHCHPIIFGSRPVMERAFKRFQPQRGAKPPRIVDSHPLDSNPTFSPRHLTHKEKKLCGQISIAAIRLAVKFIQEGLMDGVVTAPICKAHLQKAGLAFPGHTEFLAHLTQTRENRVRMMMSGPRLKVVLVTIHEPLALVPQLLSISRIKETIEITHLSLKKYFGLKTPRIALAGFNPHAGEEGMFGQEEKTLILPALRWAQKKKMKVFGPFPPDTLFYRAARGGFDVVICMYHDQGLIPFKLLHFKDGVNITLGLPIIRTSVDHGTAFDIAWQGKADAHNLLAAALAAIKMIHNQRFQKKG